MAEFSMGWATGSTGDGASPYNQTQTTDFFRRMFIGDQQADQGVLAGFLNSLAVSSGAVDQVTVDTGAAVVYGFPYQNDVSVNLAIVRPAVGVTGGRVVLRVAWAAQTVRATVIRNTDGVAAIPTMLQVVGAFWDIPLATFTITTSGVVTVTDARVVARYAGGWPASRQGANASTWASAGTNNYIPDTPKVEVGMILWTGAAASSGNVTITYKTPYTNTPLMFLTVNETTGKVNASASPSTSTATLYWETTDGSNKTAVNIMWMAVGQ